MESIYDQNKTTSKVNGGVLVNRWKTIKRSGFQITVWCCGIFSFACIRLWICLHVLVLSLWDCDVVIDHHYELWSFPLWTFYCGRLYDSCRGHFVINCTVVIFCCDLLLWSSMWFCFGRSDCELLLWSSSWFVLWPFPRRNFVVAVTTNFVVVGSTMNMKFLLLLVTGGDTLQGHSEAPKGPTDLGQC